MSNAPGVDPCFVNKVVRKWTGKPKTWLEGGTVAPEGQLQLLGLSLAITTAHRFCRVFFVLVKSSVVNK